MSQTSSTTQEIPRTITLDTGATFVVKSNISTELETIPVIDVARIFSEKLEDRQAVAAEIREASRNIGFFYMINHGIEQACADKAMHQAKRFFELSVEKKMEVFTGLVPNEFVGYHPMEFYNRNGWKHRDRMEAFNWGYDPKEDPEALDPEGPSVSIWPTDLAGFREDMYEYHTKLLQLSRRLTRIFALALHLPEDYFDEYIKQPEASMRIAHYPQQDRSPDDQQGIGAHTDVECFTIVTQDSSGGLEVLSNAGTWIKAAPIPGSFVVNIADCFMRQTNDFFVSTVHRVINKSGQERYSAPFFFGFDRSKMLEPVPTCVSDQNPRKYPSMTCGEYYAWRTNTKKNSGKIQS